MTAVALAPAEAWADECGEWSPTLTLAADDDIGSAALQYGWVAVEACDEFTFHHYLICRVESDDVEDAPEEPYEEGAVCAVSVPSRTATDFDPDIVHRSNKDYAATIFACVDEDCDNYYGDGATGGTLDEDAAEDEHATGTTEVEEWLLVGVDSTSNTARVITDTTAVSSAMLFYPSGHTYEEQGGFWWSTDAKEVYYCRADDADLGNQEWNGYDNWEVTATLVAENTVGDEGEYALATHPWVVAATDGTNDFVRIFLQTEDNADEQQIFHVDSTDEAGAEFGLGCAPFPSGDCDYCARGDKCDYDDETGDGGQAYIAVCASEEEDCTDMEAARHGKLLWDYLNGSALNFGSETPDMVITGEPDTEYCSSGHSESDIYQATWDGSEWGLRMDSGCAELQWEYFHDPGIIPLPNNAFKMYARYLSGDIYVIYWDPVLEVWEDEQVIQITLDETPPRTDVNGCAGNVDTVVWKEGSTIDEIMFFKPDVGGVCFTAGGILYARHDN